jgi:predicted transcriptional regulator
MSTETAAPATETLKQRLEHLIRQLPDNCTWDDVYYHLEILRGLESRLADIEAGNVIPHEEVRQRFAKWLKP